MSYPDPKNINSENPSEWMKKVFQEHYSYCIDILVNRDKIEESDAQDYLMDAVIILHEKHKAGEFSSDNIPGWLLTVARNMHKASFRKSNIKSTVSLEKVEAYLGHQKQMFTNSYNPLIIREESAQLAGDERAKVDAMLQAWNQLGKVCLAILTRIREGAKLSTIQEELGYENYNSLKSTKSRCIRKLKEAAQLILQSYKNG